MLSLYIEIRCVHCKHISVYANDIRDTVVCDYCVKDINKMDGMITHQKPLYHNKMDGMITHQKPLYHKLRKRHHV